MGRRLSKQLVGAVLALLLSTFAVFGALYLAPGDPIRFLSGGRTLAPAAQQAIRAQYHLDDGFFSRYGRWIGDALHGDFGQSLISRQPVGQLIKPVIGTTFELILLSALLMVVLGIAIGTLSALRGGKTDLVASAGTSVALAAPPFVVAIVLISLFSVKLGWFPVQGAGTGFGDRLHHLVLPAVALALGGLAYVARVTRVAVAEELGREHVETARSRGLPEALVIRRHVLRNALIPISTAGGVTVATLIAGSVVVENAFGLGGLGSVLISAVNQKDFAVVQAVSLIFVVVFLILNTLIDLLYVVIDPRLRVQAP